MGIIRFCPTSERGANLPRDSFTTLSVHSSTRDNEAPGREVVPLDLRPRPADSGPRIIPFTSNRTQLKSRLVFGTKICPCVRYFLPWLAKNSRDLAQGIRLIHVRFIGIRRIECHKESMPFFISSSCKHWTENGDTISAVLHPS